MNKEYIYHTSPGRIDKIDKGEGRLFGSRLFFSYKPYSMGGDTLYRMEHKQGAFLEASELRWLEPEQEEKIKDIIEYVMALVSVDYDTALDLLSEKLSTSDLDGFEADYELTFQLQCLTCDAAAALGYVGAEITDEQGTAYIADMFGKELMLELVQDEVWN